MLPLNDLDQALLCAVLFNTFMYCPGELEQRLLDLTDRLGLMEPFYHLLLRLEQEHLQPFRAPRVVGPSAEFHFNPN